MKHGVIYDAVGCDAVGCDAVSFGTLNVLVETKDSGNVEGMVNLCKFHYIKTIDEMGKGT